MAVMKDIEYSDLIGSVIDSAKNSLFMLKEAGIPEAEHLYNELKYEYSHSNKSELQQLLNKCFSSIYELRYRAINAYAKRIGYTNIIDLGCGISPRGLLFKNIPGFNYIGIDLPDIIKKLRIYKNDINYVAADITNYSLLKNALKDVTGKVLIITEGVLIYLTQNELKTVVQNIQAILQLHGGAWITSDFMRNDYTDAVLSASFDKPTYDKIFSIILNKRHESFAAMFNEREPAALTYDNQKLREFGFECNNIPLIPDEIIPGALPNFSPDVKNAIIANYHGFSIQCLYLNGHVTLDPKLFSPEDDTKKTFSFTVKADADQMVIYLNGRLDTMAAPELIDFFKVVTVTNRTFIFDCSNLEYISSAGLRVFLMLHKNKVNSEILITNQNSVVDEVLEQTGFKELFCK